MHFTTPVPAFDRTPRFSGRLTIASIVGGLVAVFVLDRGTGSTPVQHLYYVPIMLASATFEVAGGGLAALAAVVLYHIANPHLLTFSYAESDVVQIALFVLVGLGTATLTRDTNLLRRLAATDDLTGLHNLRSSEARLVGLMGAPSRPARSRSASVRRVVRTTGTAALAPGRSRMPTRAMRGFARLMPRCTARRPAAAIASMWVTVPRRGR